MLRIALKPKRVCSRHVYRASSSPTTPQNPAPTSRAHRTAGNPTDTLPDTSAVGLNSNPGRTLTLSLSLHGLVREPIGQPLASSTKVV